MVSEQVQNSSQGRQRLSASRLELMRLVEEGSRDFARARQLVDALIAEQVPFDESLLGGGPWQARLVPVRAALCQEPFASPLPPSLTPVFATLCRWCFPAAPCCGRPGRR